LALRLTSDQNPPWARDDEPEIADLRDIDPRIVDLVENAEANGEPQPRRPERATHHVFGAARPSRRDAGGARSLIRVGMRRRGGHGSKIVITCDRYSAKAAIVAGAADRRRVDHRQTYSPRG
jgi:hypothetical protein